MAMRWMTGRPSRGARVRLAVGAILGVLLAVAAVPVGSAAAAVPGNDDISGATAVAALPFSATQDNLDATQNPADPVPSCGVPNNFTVWYSFTRGRRRDHPVLHQRRRLLPARRDGLHGPAGATTASPLTEVGCAASGSVQLDVTTGTTYYFMLSSFFGRPSFTFSLDTVVPPANDDISAATPVTALPFAVTQDSANATHNPADPVPSCGSANNFTVWYSYTPATDQAVTTGVPSATIYTGPPNATTASPLTEVDCSTFAPLQLALSAGTTYYFMSVFRPGPDGHLQPPDDRGTIERRDHQRQRGDGAAFQHDPGQLERDPERGRPDPVVRGTQQLQRLVCVHAGCRRPRAGDDQRRGLLPADRDRLLGPAGATPASPLTEVGCSTFLPLQVSVTAGATYYFMLGSNSPRPSFSFDVAVGDPFVGPVITAPAVNVGTDPGVCGAAVTYADLTITGNPTPSEFVSPPSGSFFGVARTVSVQAFNAVGFASTTFPVTVADTETPQVVAPSSMTVDAYRPHRCVGHLPGVQRDGQLPGRHGHLEPAVGCNVPDRGHDGDRDCH